MIETYYFCFLVIVAGAAGYALSTETVRRMKDRLYLAQQAESELRREVSSWRVRVADGTAKIDQLAHEIATRSTASEDHIRLGALLHSLAKKLGVAEEAFGGIAESTILTAASLARESALRVPLLEEELAEADGDLSKIHALCDTLNIPAGPASDRVREIVGALVRAQVDLQNASTFRRPVDRELGSKP